MSDEEIRLHVIVGDPAYDHLSISVLGRLHPRRRRLLGWELACHTHRSRGGQVPGQGRRIASGRRAAELPRCPQDSFQTLDGEAVLKSMEEWLTLRVAITSRGRMEVTGTLLDRPGDGNHLISRSTLIRAISPESSAHWTRWRHCSPCLVRLEVDKTRRVRHD